MDFHYPRFCHICASRRIFFTISLHMCHVFVFGMVFVYNKDELKIDEINKKTMKGAPKWLS